MPAAAIGLDFGTTNCAIARLGPDGHTELARFPGPQGPTGIFRSILYFEEGEGGGPLRVYAGPDAIRAYLESDEKQGRLMQSLKSFLASRLFTSSSVFGRSTRLEDLIALLLRPLREQAERDFGQSIERVLVGRPVHFAHANDASDDEFALERLRAALHNAGLRDVSFEYEPVGASYHYEQGLERDELILIADFGGGTSDFSLLRVGPSCRGRADREGAILGHDGVGLAGDAFDGQLIRHVVAPRLGRGSAFRSTSGGELPVPGWIYRHLERWHHLSFLRSPKTLRAALRPAPRGARARAPRRADLRRRTRPRLPAAPLDRGCQARALGSGARGVPLRRRSPGRARSREEVTRSDFEAWIADELAAIAACVDRLLARTGVATGEIDRVFLTGGSSLVPSVREIFARALRRRAPARRRRADLGRERARAVCREQDRLRSSDRLFRCAISLSHRCWRSCSGFRTARARSRLASVSSRCATVAGLATHVTHAGDDRLFIAERQQQDPDLEARGGSARDALPRPLGRVDTTGDGTLASVAFHPDDANNRRFFVSYTEAGSGGVPMRSVIARYSVSAANPDLADPGSAALLLRVDEPATSHNGDQLAFAPDGTLFASYGDGARRSRRAKPADRSRMRRRSEPIDRETTPLQREILATLGTGGGYFFRQLADSVGSQDDGALVDALWDLVWSGLVSNDTFAPVRSLVSGGKTAHSTRRAAPRARLHRGRALPRPSLPSRQGPPTVSGRWSIVPVADTSATRRAHALGETMLERYGVVTRGAVMGENVLGGFALVYKTLSGFEEMGAAAGATSSRGSAPPSSPRPAPSTGCVRSPRRAARAAGAVRAIRVAQPAPPA